MTSSFRLTFLTETDAKPVGGIKSACTVFSLSDFFTTILCTFLQVYLLYVSVDVHNLQAHQKQLAEGDFDYSFWKKGMFHQDKKNYEPPYEFYLSRSTSEGDKPLSKDWQYYKKVKQDPEFDKEQGKKSNVPLWV